MWPESTSRESRRRNVIAESRDDEGVGDAVEFSTTNLVFLIFNFFWVDWTSRFRLWLSRAAEETRREAKKEQKACT
jgi:hypothetical protein